MRFSLQDIPKRVQRRGGELTVTLHFLREGESRGEIARLIAYHEQMLGQPQRAFNIDDARTLVGDYRLAHCLLATLSAWYSWRSPGWDGVIGRMGGVRSGETDDSALADAGITSPVQLRLALFDYVNAYHAGFLDAQNRSQALAQFAVQYGMSVTDLEYLLLLDTDEEAVLMRDGSEQSPMPDDVAALYNQWVFEAAMFNASEAHFVIDCDAFLEVSRTRSAVASTPITGIGAVVKRLCFLARKLSVYYDLSYEASGAKDLDSMRLHLTLYGPQDMTGAPQQYGARLARLCRLLLSYGATARPTRQTKLPTAAIVQADAVVHFLQRAYRFAMDAQLLALLPSQDVGELATEVYDSGIEQSFAEAFASLARSNAADGWELEREPEPLLLPSHGAAAQGIFIPDFALTRDRHRLYLEILGFWTPSYRERKAQKLQQLKGRNDILLAIPVEAMAAFASIASDFPIAEYDEQLSATEVLQVLRVHIDDFAERLAGIDRERVRRRIREAGWLPERAAFAELHCYRRSELVLVAESIVDDDIDYVPGAGFYDRRWLEQIGASFVEWLGEYGQMEMGIAGDEDRKNRQGKVSLVEALEVCRTRWPILANGEDAALEILLGLVPGVRIRRSSIFEVMIELAAISGPESIQEQASPSKKVVRERRAAYKKRPAGAVGDALASQQDLWG